MKKNMNTRRVEDTIGKPCIVCFGVCVHKTHEVRESIPHRLNFRLFALSVVQQSEVKRIKT